MFGLRPKNVGAWYEKCSSFVQKVSELRPKNVRTWYEKCPTAVKKAFGLRPKSVGASSKKRSGLMRKNARRRRGEGSSRCRLPGFRPAQACPSGHPARRAGGGGAARHACMANRLAPPHGGGSWHSGAARPRAYGSGSIGQQQSSQETLTGLLERTVAPQLGHE